MEARQPFQQLPAQQAVFGLQIRDPELASRTRKVISLALGAAFIILIQFIYNVIWNRNGENNSVGAYAAALVLALVVPCCGYFGAKNNDSNLTCCFCGCNFLGGCGNILAVILVFVGVAALQYVIDKCDPAHQADNCPDLTKLCPSLADGYTAEDCYKHIQDNINKAKVGQWVAAVFMVPSVCLQCCSFYHGNELYKVLKQGQVIVAAPQFQTAPVIVQPTRP